MCGLRIIHLSDETMQANIALTYRHRARNSLHNEKDTASNKGNEAGDRKGSVKYKSGIQALLSHEVTAMIERKKKAVSSFQYQNNSFYPKLARNPTCNVNQVVNKL